MDQHINSITSIAWLHLRNLFKIRSCLTQEACIALVHAFVTSRIDLYNSLLYGVPQNQLNKIQKVLNCAAKLILGGKKFDSVTPLLDKLHWLPIEKRIEYKLLVITYKCMHNQGPEYLKEHLIPYTTARNLRSTNENLLTVPITIKVKRIW